MSAATENLELTTQPITIRCGNGHFWTEVWPVPCLMSLWLQRLNAASKCPRCEAKTFLGGAASTETKITVGTELAAATEKPPHA